MKLTLRYESEERTDLTIRITLSEKHVAGMTGRKCLELFGKQFKAKFDEEFSADAHELKVVGGRVLATDDLIADYVGAEAEM